MPVTMRIITAESGSIAKAASTRSEPTSIQGKRRASSSRASGAMPLSWKNATTDSAKETATVAHAMAPTSPFPARRWMAAPRSPSRTAPKSGASGIAAT
jgi:hypothetical protein